MNAHQRRKVKRNKAGKSKEFKEKLADAKRKLEQNKCK